MTETHDVDVCIAGGGPAGMLLGLLLARRGIHTLVLERHDDFEREYRGEVLMPRFTQALRQVGLFDFLETYPHTKLTRGEIVYKDRILTSFDFQSLCPEAPFAIWMPQPTMLNAFHDKAKTFPSFELWFGASAQELVEDNDTITGLVVRRQQQETRVRARVTVGADGRTSRIRRLAHLENEYEHHDFDVLWFSFPRPDDRDDAVRFFLSSKQFFLVAPKHPDLIQVGMIVPVGEFSRYRDQGLEAMRRDLLLGPPIAHSFARGLTDFKAFFPLQARISLARQWARDGLLLIGDAAHTCSPAGAVGVSVAVATAIVAADVIAGALEDNDVTATRLGRVQQLREQDVRQIHKRQQRLTGTLVPTGFKRRLLPFLIPLMSRLGLVRGAQRGLAVAAEPLPVGDGQ